MIRGSSFRMSSSDELCIILDLNFHAWNHVKDIHTTIRSLGAFTDLYLAQSQSNSVSFYLAYNEQADLAWTSSGRLHLSVEMLLSRINDIVEEQGKLFKCSLASALSKSLCRINRIQRMNLSVKVNGRVLLVTPGTDGSDHYVSLMNSSFCAQKLVMTCSLKTFV